MKRFFLCVLIFALALTLIGCSGNNATDDSEEESEESSAPVSETPAPETEA